MMRLLTGPEVSPAARLAPRDRQRRVGPVRDQP
jgi:hypothetical protein